MNAVMLVAGREIRSQVRSKGFVIGLLVTVLVMVGLTYAPKVFGGPDSYKIGLVASERLQLPGDVEVEWVEYPAEEPARRAVLAGTVETAVNALWDAAPLVGDRVAVVGAGMVGCCVARLLARFPAVEVTLVDVDGTRAGVAATLYPGKGLVHGCLRARGQVLEVDRLYVYLLDYLRGVLLTQV